MTTGTQGSIQLQRSVYPDYWNTDLEYQCKMYLEERKPLCQRLSKEEEEKLATSLLAKQGVQSTDLEDISPTADMSPTTAALPSPMAESAWWCWVVLAASFLTLALLDGVNYSFGVLMEPLSRDIGGGTAGVSLAGSMQTAVYCLSGPLASRLTDRFGTQKVCALGNILSGLGLILASFCWSLPGLLLTYSLVAGLGFGLMYITAIVAVAEHFKSRRSLAIGICVCGTGVGTFVLAPLESVLLEQLGWRYTLVLLGGLCLLSLLGSATMCSVPSLAETRGPEDKYSGEPERSGLVQRIGCFVLGRDLFNHPNLNTFLLVTLADFVGTLALLVPFTYLPSVAHSCGIHSTQSAWLLSGIGLTSSLGRVLSGWLNDLPWVSPVLLTASVVFAAAWQSLLLVWCTGYPMFLLFSCLYGLFTGVWIAATTPVVLDVLSLHLLTPAFGLMTAVQGSAALVGAPLAGAAADYFQSSLVPLIMAAAVLHISAIVFFISYFHQRTQNSRNRYQELP